MGSLAEAAKAEEVEGHGAAVAKAGEVAAHGAAVAKVGRAVGLEEMMEARRSLTRLQVDRQK